MTSIDTPEFRELLNRYWQCDVGGSRDYSQERILSFIDAKIAEAVNRTSSRPWLGNATTAELLNELTVRAEIHGYANYRTVDGD